MPPRGAEAPHPERPARRYDFAAAGDITGAVSGCETIPGAFGKR